MKIKEKANEFKEEHPTVAGIVDVVMLAGIGAALGVGIKASSNYIDYIKTIGLRIDVSTFASREMYANKFGDARELKNAALGIDAKGLNSAQTWARYHAIVDPYIGKAS